jgi:hypothetical protein
MDSVLAPRTEHADAGHTRQQSTRGERAFLCVLVAPASSPSAWGRLRGTHVRWGDAHDVHRRVARQAAARHRGGTQHCAPKKQEPEGGGGAEGSAANNQSPPGSGAERPCTLSEMTKLLSVGTVIWATVTFFAGGSPTAGSYFDAPSGFYRSRGEGVSFALTFVAGAHDT